jgi:hypothetical protein
MGLKERRSIEEYKDGVFDEFASKIKEVIGKELSIDVDWEQLAIEERTHEYAGWSKIFFEPLIESLTNIAKDEMGKKALAEKVTNIKIQNTSGSISAGSSNWFSFEDGVITLDHKLTNYSQDTEYLEKVKKLTSSIEARL